MNAGQLTWDRASYCSYLCSICYWRIYFLRDDRMTCCTWSRTDFVEHLSHQQESSRFCLTAKVDAIKQEEGECQSQATNHNLFQDYTLQRKLPQATPTTMIRSILVVPVLVLAFLFEVEGLAAIVRRVRTGLFGIRRARAVSHVPSKTVVSQPRNEGQAFGTPAVDSFDPDSYRREMTDLVYQRNMQRLHVE